MLSLKGSFSILVIQNTCQLKLPLRTPSPSKRWRRHCISLNTLRLLYGRASIDFLAGQLSRNEKGCCLQQVLSYR